jgi:hypothetical protein
MELNLGIAAIGKNLIPFGQHRTHRHLTPIRCPTCLIEGQSHTGCIPIAETHNGASL